MKTKLLLFFLLVSFTISAQIEDAWVYFNDKPSSAYYLANPLDMLSQRALDRRTTQGIALDIIDVPVEQNYIDQITSATGITVMAKSKWLNALHIRGTQVNIQALTGFLFVDYIDFANHSLNPGGRVSSSNKNLNVSKELELATTFNYGNSANQIQMLNGHLLHQSNYTGQGKIVAVLDAGFPGVNTASSFQRLRDNNLILGGYNFPDRNTNFYTRNSHGTNVLSTIGGYVDGQLVGTAPDASFYLFITEDVNSENPVEESYWVEAAEMADSLGVDVINSSLGYTDYDNPNYSYDYSQRTGLVGFASRGADVAYTRGMICVISAGNEGGSSEPHISIPADAINVLTIGAVTNTETYATFSSIGPSFDGRIKPDICAKGQNATVSNTSGGVTTSNGTSFSSPIMAGMVATFWSAVPNMTNTQIMNFIKQSADQFATPDQFKGYGVPDFQLALNNALSAQSFETNNLVIYPNPSNEFLFLKFSNTALVGKFVIYNNLGQMVLQNEVSQNNQKISVSNLTSGVYLYEFISNNSILLGKLMKQ
jgi:serine protease AprX